MTDEKGIQNFKCHGNETFEFKYNNIFYKYSFIGGTDIKVEFGTGFKIIQCTPIEFNDYYSFCYRLAEQIINKIESEE